MVLAGDIKGSGDVFWRSLVLMLVSDPSNLAAFQCIRSMFGAPAPHAENLKKRWVSYALVCWWQRALGAVLCCAMCAVLCNVLLCWWQPISHARANFQASLLVSAGMTCAVEAHRCKQRHGVSSTTLMCIQAPKAHLAHLHALVFNSRACTRSPMSTLMPLRHSSLLLLAQVFA
jgi:hypothetical protein